MAKRTSPSSAAIEAIKAFINSVSILKREERTESLIASLYAIRKDARQEIVELLQESVVRLDDTLSETQIEILSKECDLVIRYCHESIINSGVKTNRTVRIPEELVDFCVKAAEVKPGANILLPYSDNAEFAFALKNCKCRGFAQSKYRWALMQVVLAAYKNPADIRHIGAMERSDAEKEESIKYDFMFSMPPLTVDYSAFNASFIMQMVEQNMLKKDGTVCLLLPVESTSEHEWLSFREILVRNLVMYDVSVVFMPALLRPVIDTDICAWFITKRIDDGGHIMLADVRDEKFFYDDVEAERYVMKTASIIESIKIGEKGIVSFISNAGMDSEYRFRVPSLLSVEAIPSIHLNYSYEDGYKIIRGAVNSLRGVINDYRVVMYLLHYYRTGLFDSYYSGDTPDSFIAGRIHSDFEHKLFQVFSSSLAVFREHRELFERFLVSLGQLDNSWYKKHEARLFDELLSLVQDIEGRNRGEFSQPMALTQFVAKISGYDGNGTLYNPFAGSASYCVALAGSGRYVAQEINQTAWAMGVLRLYACGMDPSSFYYEDSIHNWRGLSGIDEVAEHFDCIVATPPFSMKVRDYHLPWAFGDFSFGEDIFIWNCLESIAVSGIAIGVFAQPVASRGGKSLELRQRYVDADILDTVILLPGNVFPSTSIPTLILKFTRKKERPGFVRIVDGSSFSKKDGGRSIVLFDDLLAAIQSEDNKCVRFVSLDQIRDNDYNINPPRYFKEELTIPDGFELKKLDELVDVISGELVRSGEGKGRVVNVGALSNSPFDHELDIASLPEETLNRNFRRIISPVLLLSKVRNLKPTYAYASKEAPIYLNPNVLACRIKDGVNVFIPELVLALSKVDDFQTGAYIPSISIATIRSIKVLLPKDYSMQEAMYSNAEREYKLAKVREHGLEDLLASQKRDFILVLRNRKHDINTFVANIRNRVRGLDKYLRKNGLDKGMYSVRQNTTVGDNLSAIIKSLDQMGEYLDHIADESQYGFPMKVDLCEKLSSISNGLNYSVEFKPDTNSLCFEEDSDVSDTVHAFVSISPRDLDHVILNIVSNAATHGFVDQDITDYQIVISLTYDKETDMYVAEFRNNGKPMVEGLDTSRYGTDGAKFGPTQGNGHGGAIVKDTIEHFGGSMEIVNAPEEVFPVRIIIKLPRYDGE
jgi:type I restriction enzyme M protein